MEVEIKRKRLKVKRVDSLLYIYQNGQSYLAVYVSDLLIVYRLFRLFFKGACYYRA
jgi:hypothetical protein